MNDFYSDKQLKKLFGMRPSGIAIFEPMELGWVCPIKPEHEIGWSEFNKHIWCYQCKKDYFTLLCPKQMNPFTTKRILQKEIEQMAKEISKWTLEKYKNHGSNETPTTQLHKP